MDDTPKARSSYPHSCNLFDIDATVQLIESVTPSPLPPSPSPPPRRHDPQLDLALISGYVCLLFLLAVLALFACCNSRRNATNPNKPLHLGTSLLGDMPVSANRWVGVSRWVGTDLPMPVSVNRQPGNLREHLSEQPLWIIT